MKFFATGLGIDLVHNTTSRIIPIGECGDIRGPVVSYVLFALLFGGDTLCVAEFTFLVEAVGAGIVTHVNNLRKKN